MKAQPSAGPGELVEAVALADVDRMRRAIRAQAERLRGAPDDAEEAAFAEVLGPLTTHEERRIRQAVADAADVLPSGAFDALLTRLLVDGDHYVRAAIEAAARRRARRRKARARVDDEERALAEILATIEKKHGKDARRLAERATRRGTEYFVRKLHHEVSKVATPLEYSLNRLRTFATHEPVDRSAITRDVMVACNRFNHLWSILDRARSATSAVTPRFTEEPLLPLVEEARSQLALRLGSNAGRLSFSADVAPALRMHIHRDGLLQALQNFFQNAVEAYPDDAPRLDVRVAARTLRAGSQLEIAVTDRGVGMSEVQRENLFVPFGSRKPGGTGLGLLIARTMIEELHGGTLAFESARGVGTTVKVLLPSRQTGVVSHG